MEQGELRSRIKNRRFLKKMAALTGVAPVSLGLKDRDPELLDDKAEWSPASGTTGNKIRIAAPLNPQQTKLKRAAGPALRDR